MNFLAHAILTPPPPGNDELLVGNITADWIKGRERRALSAGIQAGFTLHRRIDGFTDTHPQVARCGGLLAETWGRYSSILVDVIFDHLIACDFERYADARLREFAARTYATLHAHRVQLPQMADYAICMMAADDWLCAYATTDGLRLTFTRMSARLQARGHDVELAPAVDTFLAQRAAFEEAFELFFPALQSYARRCVSEEALIA